MEIRVEVVDRQNFVGQPIRAEDVDELKASIKALLVEPSEGSAIVADVNPKESMHWSRR